MTIHTYYFTFGFKITKDAYLRIHGYTMDKLPKELKNACISKEFIALCMCRKYNPNWKKLPKDIFKLLVSYIIPSVYYEEDLAEAFNEWLIEECHDSVWAISHEFNINNSKYIARGFTHDTGEDDYVVIGIDMGSVDRDEGIIDAANVDLDVKNQLIELLKHEEWIHTIQASAEVNRVQYGCNAEYSVVNLLNDRCKITPDTYTTTDDCSCCS